MTTTDTVLLIILTSLLSIFTLLGIGIAVIILKTVKDIRRVVSKAETLVDSVESAAEAFKDAKGRMAFFKLISNLVKLANKRSK